MPEIRFRGESYPRMTSILSTFITRAVESDPPIMGLMTSFKDDFGLRLELNRIA